jgi:prepilin-type N-terminal cleavage/methylation domain-containing protein
VTRSRRGFSLLELTVVLFILSIALAVLLPRLPGLSESRKNAALRRLAGMAQALHEEAAFKKKAWL